MKKHVALRQLFAFALLGVLLLFAACRAGPVPTSTPAPPTPVVPPTLPPAPSAAPLTAAPTAVLPTQAPPPAATDAAAPPSSPAATDVPATSAPAVPTSGAGGTTGNNAVPPPQPGALQGLYVSGLRHTPDVPRPNEPVNFYVTLANRTGTEQHYPVCVEIFRPGEAKSFGISNCDTVTIAPGTGEVAAGIWTASGIKECIPVRARAVLSEIGQDDIRQVFVTLNGEELWVDFNVCP